MPRRNPRGRRLNEDSMTQPITVEVNQASIESLIRESIKVAAAEALSRQSPALVRELVDRVVGAKKDSYSRLTLFEESLHTAIREETNAQLKLWMDQHRAEIRDIIATRLQSRKGLSKQIADSLVASLGEGLRISVSFDAKV